MTSDVIGGYLLGAVCVTPLVVLYALFIRWCDRFEPEPWWILIVAFLWGAVFATLGGGMSSAFVEKLFTDATGANGEAVGATVLAPIFEEGFKGLGVALIALVSILGLKELDGPLDGAIYGGIIGLGFTLTEDILYISRQFAVEGIAGLLGLFVLRTVFLGLSHCTFTAMTGIGFGVAIESKNTLVRVLAPLIGYFAAMGMHAFHNFLPTYFGSEGTVAMILVSWIINLLFFLLLGFLVSRDRAIVIRELLGEVGKLLHPRELPFVSSYLSLGVRNAVVLFTVGWASFRDRRHKQLALVELAFLKNRRRRGEHGPDLDTREAKLRADIEGANQRGVWLGS